MNPLENRDPGRVRRMFGAIAGRYPKSPWKIAGLVLAGLLLLALVALFVR